MVFFLLILFSFFFKRCAFGYVQQFAQLVPKLEPDFKMFKLKLVWKWMRLDMPWVLIGIFFILTVFGRIHWAKRIQPSCFCVSEEAVFVVSGMRCLHVGKGKKYISHQAILVSCRCQADYEVMWQLIAPCFLFKHEHREAKCVETCQSPKNARFRDFNLPIGASDLDLVGDGSFYIIFTTVHDWNQVFV